jgi:HEAT repeat protein
MQPMKSRTIDRLLAAKIGIVAFFLCLGHLGIPGQLRAQEAAGDGVDRLRGILQDTTDDAPLRDQKLRECVSGLRGIGDLRRAINLTEWRDNASAVALATVDRTYHKAITDRFQAAIREILQSRSSTTANLGLDLLVEMAAEAHPAGDAVTRPFTADVINLIQHGDPRLLLPATRTLGTMDADPVQAVPTLSELLRSNEAVVRRAATTSLANLLQSTLAKRISSSDSMRPMLDRLYGAETANTILQALTPGYRDSQAEIRACCAASSLRTATALMRALSEGPAESVKDDVECRRLHTLIVRERTDLGSLVVGMRDQLPLLARAIRDDDVNTRLTALKALEALAGVQGRWVRQGTWLAGQSESGTFYPVDDPLGKAFQSMLPHIAGALTDADAQVRMEAMEVLDALGPAAGPAAPAAAQALSDKNRFVRWSAVRTLKDIGAPAALPAIPMLARLLEDDDVDVDLAAIDALVHLDPNGYGVPARGKPVKNAPPRNAVAALAQAVKSRDGEVRVAAIRALAGMGQNARPAVAGLCGALGDTDPRVRHAAAAALGQLGRVADDAVPDLNLALKDADPNVRRAASDALLRITHAAQP